MTNNDRLPVLVVAGPTASGKSALALSLAEAAGGAVINADSMQVYRELRILTARPSPVDERRCPHHLYGIIPAAEACTAARWRDLAIEAVREAHDAGRLPIVCGGTGLYLKALLDGLSPMPDIPADLRADVRARYAEAPAVAIHSALSVVDEKAAARIRPTDRQRLLRALEVFEATARSIVDWQSAPTDGPPAGMDFVTLALLPPREILYATIDERVERMVDQGALDEVAALLRLGLSPELPAMRALGVVEFGALIAGRIGREEAISAVQQATRNYAKRQFTWFRRQLIADLTIEKQYSEKLAGEIFSYICEKGLTRTR